MNLQGDFEGLTLASILQLLCNDQKTGVLTVKSGNEESRVFFEKGAIVYASASLKESRLGYMICNDGLISSQQLQKCLSWAKEERVHLGKIMVEKGYITLETFKKYNAKQTEAILYNLLLWEKGNFDYKDTPLNLKELIITQLNPMKLILEASRRVDELSVLKKSIPSDRLVFKMSGKVINKEELRLKKNEWRILSLIDGIRTVRQIITKSGYDDFIVYKLLFSVISSGLIEKAGVKPSEREATNDYSAILAIFNDVLQSIKKNIVDELGDRSYSLFEESKSRLVAETKDMFKDYHPDNHKNVNLQVINLALKNLEHIKNRKEFLISGFTEYCSEVLKKAGGILGVNPLIVILDDTEKVLGYVKKYQTGSEKSIIVNSMRALIAAIRSEFNTEGKKVRPGKGIFSLFS